MSGKGHPRIKSTDLGKSIKRQILSPKRTVEDRNGIYSWVRYHAGFSPRFVDSVISYLRLDRRSEVFDPFVGTGTTCLQAKIAGVPSKGIEMNGFAYFISRARLGWRFDDDEFERSLLDVGGSDGCGTEEEVGPAFGRWFAADDEAPAEILRMGHRVREIPNADLRDFLTAALALSVRLAPGVKTGSNPAWSHAGRPRRGPRPDFGFLFIRNARKMLMDQESVRALRPAKAIVVQADARTLDFGEGISAIISSPPYLSRLDYVMAHRIENDLLAALGLQSDPDLLRLKLVGGVIRDGKPALKTKAEWGEVCTNTLQSVKEHPSKGSLTYYYPLMVRYFHEMFECMKKFRNAVARDGTLVLVAQTSYYKEIELPLPDVLRAMARNVGFKTVRTIFRVNVANTIGNMDPEQRAYVGEKRLHEDVLLARP